MIILELIVWLLYSSFVGWRMFDYLQRKISGFRASMDCFVGLLITLCAWSFILWHSVT